jgi:hypothetical protein
MRSTAAGLSADSRTALAASHKGADAVSCKIHKQSVAMDIFGNVGSMF